MRSLLPCEGVVTATISEGLKINDLLSSLSFDVSVLRPEPAKAGTPNLSEISIASWRFSHCENGRWQVAKRIQDQLDTYTSWLPFGVSVSAT